MSKASLHSVVAGLENMFSIFNTKFYNKKLQTPVIAVSSDGGIGAYGWLTTWKAWAREGTDGYYEINMSAEYLARPFDEVCATMLHEMVHLWNLQNEVQDTSRGGTYHNKKFKIEADQRGLLISQHAKYGWTLTELNQEGANFINENTLLANMKKNGFQLYRSPMNKTVSSKSSRKSSSRKYICPSCEQSIRATKVINIICGECNEQMECEDGDDEE